MTEAATIITADKIASAIIAGRNKPRICNNQGACRVYLGFYDVTTKQLNQIKKALSSCGIRYIGKAYGSGNKCAYIGYDNFRGNLYPMAQNIASEIKMLGIKCYADAIGD
jgi:hypothetical protein